MARPLFTSVRRLACASLAAATLLLLGNACGSRQAAPELAGEVAPQPEQPGAAGAGGFGLALPVDRPLPWDAGSGSAPAWLDRRPSGLNADSTLVLGNDYFMVGGQNGASASALTLDTEPLGQGNSDNLAYAIYRLAMAGQEPGVVTVDASPNINSFNLSGADAKFEYWAGVANYTDGAWQWYGPFSDSNIRISTAKLVRNGRSLLSPLGNSFVALVVFGGPEIDIAAVGANPLDPADSSAPPAPSLMAEPIPGGAVATVVNGVAPLDLAGQRVYYSSADFSQAATAEVKHFDSLNGLPQLIVPGSGKLFIGVTNIDISGNESALSNVVEVDPQPQGAAGILVGANIHGGTLDSMINLHVSGTVPAGCQYYYDFDGDGQPDEVSPGPIDPAAALADTTQLGLIRPAVRIVDGDGVMVAQGSTSLVISASQPPVATLAADRTLLIKSISGGGEGVEFDASGSSDPNGGTLSYYFAFEGGGDYGNGYSNPLQTHYYDALGSYVCVLKVKNSAGLFATASLGIQVMSMAATRLNDQGAPVATLSDITAPGYYMPAAVAYYDSATDSIKVQRAANSAGTSWMPPETAADNLLFCDSLTILADADSYMLAYSSSGVLYFTETVGAGYAWESPVTVRSLSGGRDAGHSCTLESLDGQPNIAYYEEESAGGSVALKYVQPSDSSHASWLTPTTCAAGLPPEVLTAQDNLDVSVIASNAAVVYAASGELRYKRSFYFQNQTPLWPADPAVLSVNSSGNGLSMMPVGNTPAVVFNTNAAGAYFIHSADNGANWGDPVQISTRNISAAALSWAKDKPCVLLAENGVDAPVYFCSALDTDGTEWGFTKEIVHVAGTSNAAMIRGGNGWPLAAFLVKEPESNRGVYVATLGY